MYMPLIEDNLPIYWSRKIAVERCQGFFNYKVKRIEMSKIFNLIDPNPSIPGQPKNDEEYEMWRKAISGNNSFKEKT